MSVIATALNQTHAGNSRTQPITAELVGLNDTIFKSIEGALGFLSTTRRFPSSPIPQEQRPSTKEHTISAMHRADKLLSEDTALDPKTIASILRKIMIHDFDEVIGREFHAVTTDANGTAVKDMEGFSKLTEKIALNTILVALLNADPEVNAPAPSTTHRAQKAFPSLKEFIDGLRHEIKNITNNDVGVKTLNEHFEKADIKERLNPEWLSPDYRKAFESLKSDYLSMESNPKEQDSISSLIGKLLEKWDGIITTNTTNYFSEKKSHEVRKIELGYTTTVMNRIVSVRDTLNMLINGTKELLKESLSKMGTADNKNYQITDFPEQLGWMQS
jgi:hypothetical protein